MLFTVDGGSSGLTRREPVRCLPRLKDKIHGIDYRRRRIDDGAEGAEPSWLIVIHAGREAYSLVLGKVGWGDWREFDGTLTG